MNPDTIKIILLIALILGATILILKSLIKAAIVTFIIILLFRIGWVYDSGDLKNNFLLDKLINYQKIESVFTEYEKYVDKRREKEVIDTEEIDRKIREEMNKKVKEYMDSQPTN